MLSDTDEPLDVVDVPASTKLESILMGASGYVEAACNVGGKYSPTDLATLTGNSAKFLAKIVADLAAPEVLGRRFVEFPDYAKRLETAEGACKAVSEGTMIFGLQENIDAGILDDYVETPTDVEARQMITYQASPFFGRRANRSTW